MLNQNKPTATSRAKAELMYFVNPVQWCPKSRLTPSDLSSSCDLVTKSLSRRIKSLPAQHDISTNVLQLIRLKLIWSACETFLQVARNSELFSLLSDAFKAHRVSCFNPHYSCCSPSRIIGHLENSFNRAFGNWKCLQIPLASITHHLCKLTF